MEAKNLTVLEYVTLRYVEQRGNFNERDLLKQPFVEKETVERLKSIGLFKSGSSGDLYIPTMYKDLLLHFRCFLGINQI